MIDQLDGVKRQGIVFGQNDIDYRDWLVRQINRISGDLTDKNGIESNRLYRGYEGLNGERE